jgi:intracellular sulfur oxidation DsrE/DsrF family protein
MTVGIIRTLFSTTTALGLSVVLFSNQALALVAETEVDAQVTTEQEVQADVQVDARASTQADRAALQEEITASTAEKRAAVQEQVIQRQATLEARAQERVTNLSANMSNRMEAIIARLQNISDRLESRIVKMNESGVDTTASAAALASAQLSLDGALAEISDIDASVYAAVSAADVRSGWATLKAKFEGIRDLIKTAHSELQRSISLLKEASVQGTVQQDTEVSTE